jgi:chorismate--pyruvate lyase
MKPRYPRFPAEPRWAPVRYHSEPLPSDKFLFWLLDSESLTARLRARCRGKLTVEVLSEAWQRPLRSERVALGMRDHEFGMVRQVRLLCSGTPWVYARTVIPGKTLRGRNRRLTRLGSKPLGEMLFTDKTMRRSEVEIGRLAPEHVLYGAALATDAPASESVWGRRSVFFINNKPLLVNEIFLPALVSG